MRKAADSFVKMARDATTSQGKIQRGSVEVRKAIQRQADAITSLKGGYVAAGVALVGFVAAAAKAARWMRENAELAAEQERAERRAIAAIRQRGEFTDEAFEALQRFNAENQQAIGIGDEAALQLQGTLAAMGLLPDQLQEATRATIGLAEATGQDLNAAARLVARTMQGETSALKRYGITADTTEEAMGQLAKMFEIAKAQSDTLATRVKVAEANFGDLREELGKSVTKSEAAAKAMEGVNKALLQMIDFFSSGRGTSGLDAFFSLLHKGLIVATDATRSMVRGLAAITGSDDLQTVADELYEVHKALELARQGFDGSVADNLTSEIAKRNVEAFQEIIATQDALRTILKDASLEEKAIHAQRIAQLELEIDERRKVFEESQGSLQPLLEAERKLAEEITKKTTATTQSTTATTRNTTAANNNAVAQERRLAALTAIREKMMSGQASLDAQSIKLQQEADAINMIAENEERVAAIREANHAAQMQQFEQAQQAQQQVAETVVSHAERVAGELFNVNRSMADNVKATGKLILQMIAQQIAARLKQALISKAAAKSEALTDAAGAAIKGGKAAAETPIVGPILAVAAATAVFAAMAAFTNKMQRGGMVPGGNTRGDSVPSLLEPGEFVVPRELVSAMATGRPPRTAQAITEIRRADAPAVTQAAPSLELHMHQSVPADRTENERFVRAHVLPVLRDLGVVVA